MIETKIAKVVSPTMVILAAGSKAGIREGMEFLIFELSDEIRDPETQESLGHLELPKGRVVAEHVQEKMTVATTKMRNVERLKAPLLGDTFRFLTTPQRVTESVQEQLEVESVVADTRDPVVKTGDRARCVSESRAANKVSA